MQLSLFRRVPSPFPSCGETGSPFISLVSTRVSLLVGSAEGNFADALTGRWRRLRQRRRKLSRRRQLVFCSLGRPKSAPLLLGCEYFLRRHLSVIPFLLWAAAGRGLPFVVHFVYFRGDFFVAIVSSASRLPVSGPIGYVEAIPPVTTINVAIAVMMGYPTKVKGSPLHQNPTSAKGVIFSSRGNGAQKLGENVTAPQGYQQEPLPLFSPKSPWCRQKPLPLGALADSEAPADDLSNAQEGLLNHGALEWQRLAKWKDGCRKATIDKKATVSPARSDASSISSTCEFSSESCRSSGSSCPACKNRLSLSLQQDFSAEEATGNGMRHRMPERAPSKFQIKSRVSISGEECLQTESSLPKVEKNRRSALPPEAVSVDAGNHFAFPASINRRLMTLEATSHCRGRSGGSAQLGLDWCDSRLPIAADCLDGHDSGLTHGKHQMGFTAEPPTSWDLNGLPRINTSGREASNDSSSQASLGGLIRSSMLKDASAARQPDLTSASSFVHEGGPAPDSSRARSIPLRRLLDPWLKPRKVAAGSPAPSLRGRKVGVPTQEEMAPPCVLNDSDQGSPSSCHSSHVNGSASSRWVSMGTPGSIRDGEYEMKQSLLRLTWKNGFPLFTFSVNESDILAATRKMGNPSKEYSEFSYTFYYVHEEKKKNGGWMNQGKKGSRKELVSSVAGQMNISSSRCPRYGSSVKEFVLFAPEVRPTANEAPESYPSSELAAISVRVPQENVETSAIDLLQNINGKCRSPSVCVSESKRHVEVTSPNVAVVLPSQVHGLSSKQNEGKPSPLLDRWRSGGLCDCGGWDVGCALTVLINHRQDINCSSTRTNSAADGTHRVELFFQVLSESSSLRFLFLYKGFFTDQSK